MKPASGCCRLLPGYNPAVPFRFVRPLRPWAALLFVLGLLAACAPQQSPASTTPLPSPTQPRSILPLIFAPEPPVASLAAPDGAVPSATLTIPVVDPPAPSTPAAAVALEICSPLGETPLTELGEIVSGAYAPPPPGREERHHGVDFAYYQRGGRASIAGERVQAVLAGQVALAMSESFPYGNVIVVETSPARLPPSLQARLGVGQSEALYLLYAHLDDPPLATSGDQVDACQALGVVGRSGNAGVPHLHLEVRIGPAGATLGPMAYYTAQATQEQRAQYARWRTSGEFRHIDPFALLLYQEGM